MDSIFNFFSHFVEPDPKAALLVILNLVVIESLLSVDNAAVLAALVMDLPGRLRKKALRIGLIFAYVFRGAALVFAGLLIKILWLKLLGGAYLLYLFGNFFYKKIANDNPSEASGVKRGKKIPLFNQFWSTVILVELMDLAFSIDNVFAAVAFTKNIYLVCTGVFIGIVTMRVVAGFFVQLMTKFPFLDTVAFIVIGLLGLRLCIDFTCGWMPDNLLCKFFSANGMDFYFSLITVSVFFLPVLTSVLLGILKRGKP